MNNQKVKEKIQISISKSSKKQKRIWYKLEGASFESVF